MGETPFHLGNLPFVPFQEMFLTEITEMYTEKHGKSCENFVQRTQKRFFGISGLHGPPAHKKGCIDYAAFIH